MTSRQRFLAALAGKPADRTPLFPLLMFFAQQRAGISYRTFCTDGAALAEAQLALRARFGLDAITACSDAFRLPADLGAEMAYPEQSTPHALRPLVESAADLARIGRPDPTAPGTRMADRVRAVEVMARAVGEECAVAGWVEMPFAEACSLCGIERFMTLLIEDPPLAHAVLEALVPIEIDFAAAQLRAGAILIGAGDAAASLISPHQYAEFALPYQQRVVDGIHDAGGLVKLHICGNTTHLLPLMIECGADLYNVDHLVPFDAACRAYGGANRCFKGNLDPVAEIMQSTPEACAARCRERIARAKGLPYMLSAGCEIPAATPDAVFDAFCASVR